MDASTFKTKLTKDLGPLLCLSAQEIFETNPHSLDGI